MRTMLVAVLAFVLSGCQSSGDGKIELKTHKDKVSYVIGLRVGANMVRDSLDLDYAALLQGIKDAEVLLLIIQEEHRGRLDPEGLHAEIEHRLQDVF